jgi:hypothetical protein
VCGGGLRPDSDSLSSFVVEIDLVELFNDSAGGGTAAQSAPLHWWVWMWMWARCVGRISHACARFSFLFNDLFLITRVVTCVGGDGDGGGGGGGERSAELWRVRLARATDQSRSGLVS